MRAATLQGTLSVHSWASWGMHTCTLTPPSLPAPPQLRALAAGQRRPAGWGGRLPPGRGVRCLHRYPPARLLRHAQQRRRGGGAAHARSGALTLPAPP